MDSLIAVGSSAALIYGIFAIYRMSWGLGAGDMEVVAKYHMDLYFESAVMILTLITLGKFLETRSKRKTSEAISRLTELAPETAIVELDGEEKAVSVPKEYSVDAFYFELIRLMKEIIANQVVEKRLICSIFNLLSLWADGTRSGENFRKGFLKDTPDFIVKDEARLLKEAGR